VRAARESLAAEDKQAKANEKQYKQTRQPTNQQTNKQTNKQALSPPPAYANDVGSQHRVHTMATASRPAQGCWRSNLP
jgi:hypothetical protein